MFGPGSHWHDRSRAGSYYRDRNRLAIRLAASARFVAEVFTDPLCGEQALGIDGGPAESCGDALVGQPALADVESTGEVRVVAHRLTPPAIGQRHDEWLRRVVEREGR